MICSNCGKREVEVLIKQVMGGEVRSLNLCRECAEQLGFLSPDIPRITISFTVGDGVDVSRAKPRKRQNAKQRREEQENALVCPTCGTRFSTFRETGVVGCPDCYEAFRFPLGALLQETQGVESHWVGTSGLFDEIPLREQSAPPGLPHFGDTPQSEELCRAEQDLADAIAREDYERAAELRDAISRIRGEVR